MNIKSSIGLVAVIALSLIAARAEAQNDANAQVTIHSGAVCCGCTMTVTQIVNIPGDTNTTVYPEDVWSCLGSDASQPYWAWMKYFPYGGANFRIDSVNKTIDSVTLSPTESFTRTMHNYGEATFLNILLIHFDSLPYHDSAGHLIARGVFRCGYQFSSGIMSGSGHTSYNGNCSDTGSGVDTISFEIIPSALLSVATPSRQPAEALSIVFDPSRFMISATFAPISCMRTIMIYDLLGRRVWLVTVADNAESLQTPLSLPPGCYFARLGDQVAKFVVPPR